MSGLNGKEAAVMFIEGRRSGVTDCINDLVAAAERLSKSGETMPATTLAAMAIRLQRHVPKANP